MLKLDELVDARDGRVALQVGSVLVLGRRATGRRGHAATRLAGADLGTSAGVVPPDPVGLLPSIAALYGLAATATLLVGATTVLGLA